MKAISDLKEIIENQQTIRTTRLKKYITEIGSAYAGSGRKISEHEKRIAKLKGRLEKVTAELNELKKK